MGILGTGIDMIEVERVERALTRPRTGERFRDRVYTEREVAYCESRGRPRYQSYAARFAAKEAVMKAMGTGWNRYVGWREIEVVRERGHAPTIVLSGNPRDGRRLSGRFAHGQGWLRKDATAEELRAAIDRALAPTARRWSVALVVAVLVLVVIAIAIARYALRV